MPPGARPPGPRALKIGENARAVREHKGLTRRELADRMGTTEAVVANLELGRSTMTAEQLLDLHRGLGCSLNRLLRDLPEPAAT